MVAASVYQDRHELLTKVLNDLYHLLRFETCKQIHKALDVVLSAMDKHIRVKNIQISGRLVLVTFLCEEGDLWGRFFSQCHVVLHC